MNDSMAHVHICGMWNARCSLFRPMPKAVIVEQRPMFRALPGVDLIFLVALGLAGLGACLVIGLR
jgi:hypothetical protein